MRTPPRHWIKLDVWIDVHPKFHAAAAVLAARGVHRASECVLATYVRVLAYGARHGTNGFFPETAIGSLAIRDARRILDVLADPGIRLFARELGGWRVPDFLDWQQRATVRGGRPKKLRSA